MSFVLLWLVLVAPAWGVEAPMAKPTPAGKALTEKELEAKCAPLYTRQAGAGAPPAPKKTEEDGFYYTGLCTENGTWQRVEGSEQTKKFLKGLSKKLGQQINVYECLRTPQRQNYLLCKGDCAPYGPHDCDGSIGSRTEHHDGIAADMLIKANVSLNAPESIRIAEIRRMCRWLSEARKEFAGGRGGIAVYGLNQEAQSYLHYDAKPDWCNWGKQCEIELGEGYCRRKKFGKKEAKLMDTLASAREQKARLDIMRLQRKLMILRADCPPEDLRCRDKYQK